METSADIQLDGSEIKSPSGQTGVNIQSKVKYKDSNSFADLRTDPEALSETERTRSAERQILGDIFRDPSLIDEARKRLRVEDFDSERHRLIFAAMLELHDNSIDPDICQVWEKLNERGELDIVGRAPYLTYIEIVTMPEEAGL